MNAFNKQRFAKLSIALFVTALLALTAFAIRIFAGASFSFPGTDDAIISRVVLPVFIIGAASILIAALLWLLLRKKSIRFFDLLYPSTMAGMIAIFAWFHIALLA